MLKAKRKATASGLQLVEPHGRLGAERLPPATETSLVDDESLVSRLLTLTLANSVDGARTEGVSAELDTVSQAAPGIILLDMPGLEAPQMLEVLRQVIRCAAASNAPLVVLTGPADEALRAWASLLRDDGPQSVSRQVSLTPDLV